VVLTPSRNLSFVIVPNPEHNNFVNLHRR